MDKIPIGTAKKLLQLTQGEHIAFGKLKNKLITKMIDDGALKIMLQGTSRKTVYCANNKAFANYLSNNFGISSLELYIKNIETGNTRAGNIVASTDSKSTKVRTFKGFLVNCSAPINAKINGQGFIINPQNGTYSYIHDFENFSIPPETLVVGIENSENFRLVHQQTHLFTASSVLYVSRYPQSNDLVSWLGQIPNRYLHFGDFDFEGIRIFRDEYFRYLSERASFFIPENIEELLNKYGNKALYNKQYTTQTMLELNSDIKQLLSLFHMYKKCLEQEILIAPLSSLNNS